MTFKRLIDHRIYSRKAVADARQTYSRFLQSKVHPVSSNSAEISLEVKDEHNENANEILLEFMNYLLDASAEEQLEN